MVFCRLSSCTTVWGGGDHLHGVGQGDAGAHVADIEGHNPSEISHPQDLSIPLPGG